jgi:hypothetical protein
VVFCLPGKSRPLKPWEVRWLTFGRTYVPKDGPKYHTGHTINLVGQICVLIMACVGIVYSKWENRQREMGKRDHRLEGLNEDETRDLGYRHPDFRYIH